MSWGLRFELFGKSPMAGLKPLLWIGCFFIKGKKILFIYFRMFMGEHCTVLDFLPYEYLIPPVIFL